ncbi:MAG TPA: hypothetical protein VEC60_15370, partial [Reyranella sp.]|nr:hypothetical protein [Reyranella sp.]
FMVMSTPTGNESHCPVPVTAVTSRAALCSVATRLPEPDSARAMHDPASAKKTVAAKAHLRVKLL